MAEISSEIHSVQSRPAASQQHGPLVRLAALVPRPLRLAFFRAVKLNPYWFNRLQGTVVLTSAGMFGRGGGWEAGFLPTQPMGLTVGGISRKPRGGRDDQIEPRDYLQLTLAFDHDLVDGAPAARFSRRLIELIETTKLLEYPTTNNIP